MGGKLASCRVEAGSFLMLFASNAGLKEAKLDFDAVVIASGTLGVSLSVRPLWSF